MKQLLKINVSFLPDSPVSQKRDWTMLPTLNILFLNRMVLGRKVQVTSVRNRRSLRILILTNISVMHITSSLLHCIDSSPLDFLSQSMPQINSIMC